MEIDPQALAFELCYKLVIGWDTLEDHTVHFRESAELQEFRRLAGGFVAGPSQMEHVEVVLNGF